MARALDAVGAIAGEAGATLSAGAAERAGKTLHAVALDEGVRKDFERHRLAIDHDAPGLGGLSPGAPGAARKGGRPTSSAQDDKRRKAKRRRGELKAAEAEAVKLAGRQEEAEREVEAAHQSAKQAQQILTGAIERLDKATADAAAARQRVDDLETSAT